MTCSRGMRSGHGQGERRQGAAALLQQQLCALQERRGSDSATRVRPQRGHGGPGDSLSVVVLAVQPENRCTRVPLVLDGACDFGTLDPEAVEEFGRELRDAVERIPPAGST